MDLDDVLVLNNPFGGYDAKLALDGNEIRTDEPSDIWKQLFDASACKLLMQLHREFRPIYVLTTSWWWLFTKEELAEVFERCAMSWIWNSLHVDWTTPRGKRPKDRWVEIRHWLDEHPAAADRWVVLDDTLSGTGLGTDLPDELWPFVVLCSPNVGLTTVGYEQLRAAFKMRTTQPRSPGALPT